MGFEKGRVSPETRLALVETIKGTQEDEKKKDVDSSFSTTAKPKRAGFDSNANTNAKNADEDMASCTTNSPLGRDPRARRRLFDRLLILVTFVSFATLIVALSLAFGGLGPTCSCPGKKTNVRLLYLTSSCFGSRFPTSEWVCFILLEFAFPGFNCGLRFRFFAYHFKFHFGTWFTLRAENLQSSRKDLPTSFPTGHGQCPFDPHGQ